MKTHALKTVRVLINFVLIILFAIIIVTIISLFTVNSKFDELSNRNEPCSQLISMSANNTTLVLQNDKLKDCEYSAKILTTFSKYTRISLLAKFIFIFIITLQLSLLIKTLPYDVFQNINNAKRVKFISISILLWTIIDFIIKFYPRSAIPEYLIFSSNGLNSLNVGFMKNFLSINFNLIFIAVIVYFLSFVFSKGYELQEQANSTV